MAASDLRAELRCSVCMEIYKYPVTLTCGHNFCRVCITQTWDHQTEGEYTCPECLQRFKKRPELNRNPTLSNIAEVFLHDPPEQDNTGIFCTYCDFPVTAVKSCLQCETAMCDNHLRKHDRSVEHTLFSPCMTLKKRKCPIHKKMLEYFCHDDTDFICVTCCLAGDHVGHQVESLVNTSDKKKEKLRLVLEKLNSKKVETENKVQSLQERKRELQENAAHIAQIAIAFFIDIRGKLDNLEKRVLNEIYRQEERVSLPVSDMIQQLEIKNDQLSRKMCRIEELCNMTDPLTVLQEKESDRDEFCDAKELCNMTDPLTVLQEKESDRDEFCDAEEGDNDDRERHDKQVHDVGDLDVSHISEALHALSDMITGLKKGIYTQEPIYTDMTLDVNTAGNHVHISDDLKTVSWSLEHNNYPETPERFLCNQVLSSRRFHSGRHYWEVETSDLGDWRVGVCYPSIEKKENPAIIGNNKKSWCLHRYNNLMSLAHGSDNNQYSVIHDSKYIHLPHNISCNRVRISLDYEAGRLSFYELCDPIKHLHTFTATFTEPIHAAFYVWDKLCGKGSWVRLRSLEKQP